MLDSTKTPVDEPIEYTVTEQDIDRRYASFDAEIPAHAGIYADIPKTTLLLPAMPNPFTNMTRIRLHLATSGHVTLKVYNVSGQLVKTLVDDSMKPGKYTLNWACDNNAGRRVAPGAYFYRMVAPGYEKTRKVVLLD